MKAREKQKAKKGDVIAFIVLQGQDIPEQHSMRSVIQGADIRTFAGRHSFAIFSTVAAQCEGKRSVTGRHCGKLAEGARPPAYLWVERHRPWLACSISPHELLHIRDFTSAPSSCRLPSDLFQGITWLV